MNTDDTARAVLYYIQHLAVLVGRQSDQILQEQLGLGLSQFRILQTLQTNPYVQQKQIASLLGQTEPSISRQVKLMQERGLIVSKTNAQNKREHLAVITAKGERLLRAGTQIITEYHEPDLQTLKSKEQSVLLDLLIRMHAEMCKVDGIEGMFHVGEEKIGVA
jgi:DNA-binding MarR family transcriptional regulator